MTRNSNELFPHILTQHMPGGRQTRHPSLKAKIRTQVLLNMMKRYSVNHDIST